MASIPQTGQTLPQTGQRTDSAADVNWPPLPWAEWHQTATTLQLGMQVIGKIRLALATRTNHWWHVTLYPTCRGLTTSPMPYGSRMLQIDFDFLNHRLHLQSSDGRQQGIALQPMTVAEFYRQVMANLEQLEMPVHINPMPSEVADPIPFTQDEEHSAYQPEYAARYWQILLRAEQAFTKFRARFTGKVSPAHLFWGGFDFAVTRFSGRMAPPHASVPHIPDRVVHTAYSHEVSSCGFWPGGPLLPEPLFYAYAYPTPAGFGDAPIEPPEAYFHGALGEFILPYEAIRAYNDPTGILLRFLQSTYEAAANLGQWPRSALEADSDDI